MICPLRDAAFYDLGAWCNSFKKPSLVGIVLYSAEEA